jgi:hypothetical protein
MKRRRWQEIFGGARGFVWLAAVTGGAGGDGGAEAARRGAAGGVLGRESCVLGRVVRSFAPRRRFSG